MTMKLDQHMPSDFAWLGVSQIRQRYYGVLQVNVHARSDKLISVFGEAVHSSQWQVSCIHS